MPGKVETRRSKSDPPVRRESRPSCGTRFSAMFMCEITLMRDMAGRATLPGRAGPSCRTPSTRYRTRTRSRSGWTWTSLAPVVIPRAMTALTRRMIGSSSALEASSSMDSSSISSDVTFTSPMAMSLVASAMMSSASVPMPVNWLRYSKIESSVVMSGSIS